MPSAVAEREARRVQVGKIAGTGSARAETTPATPMVFPLGRRVWLSALLAGAFAVAVLSRGIVEYRRSVDQAVPRSVSLMPLLRSFEDAASWDSILRVQDTKDAISVLPLVSPERDGGFLVADPREAQIRRYSSEGALLTSFGRRGHGPGEFVSLSGVLRIDQEHLLATDMNGQLTTTLNDGEVVRTDRVPLTPLYGAAKFDDSTVVLLGRSRGEGRKYLLHFWDTKNHVLRLSFFPEPDHGSDLNDAYRYTGFPYVAVRGESIAATFAIDQRIRFFDKYGRQTDSRIIPFRDFRALTSPIPSTDSPEAFQAWVESFSVISRVYWLEDGTFLILYFDKIGQEPQWRLLQMTAEGKALFEGPSPRLLTTLSQDVLLFSARDFDEPNVWQFVTVDSSKKP